MEIGLQILSLEPTANNGTSAFRNTVQLHKLTEQIPNVDSLFAKETPHYITQTNKFEFEVVVKTRMPVTAMMATLRIVFANYLAKNDIPNPANVMVVSVGDRPMDEDNYCVQISHTHVTSKVNPDFAKVVLDSNSIQLHIAQTLYLAANILKNQDYYKTAIGMLFRLHEARVGAQQNFIDSMNEIGIPELAEKYAMPDMNAVLSDDLDLLFGLGRYHKSIVLYIAGIVNRAVL